MAGSAPIAELPVGPAASEADVSRASLGEWRHLMLRLEV